MTTARESTELKVDQTADLFDKCWERIKLALKVKREGFERESDELEPDGASNQAPVSKDEAEPAPLQSATDQAASNESQSEVVFRQLSTADVSRGAEKPDDRMFAGEVRLEIVPSYGWNEGEGVPGWLREVPGLRVISTGGYYGVNRWITTCTVSLDQPAPLLGIFKVMSQAQEVREHDGSILIRLR